MKRFSLAWLEGPQRWILLYGRSDAVVARLSLGKTPWSWSDETQIIFRNSVETCSKTRRRKGGSYPLSHLYGHFGLVRLSRLGHDVPWVKA